MGVSLYILLKTSRLIKPFLIHCLFLIKTIIQIWKLLIYVSMLPYTQNSLNKLENLLNALGFKIRYERGSFRSGTCILQQENVLVINRFSDIEVKIKSMVQVIQSFELSDNIELDEKQHKLYYSLSQMILDL